MKRFFYISLACVFLFGALIYALAFFSVNSPWFSPKGWRPLHTAAHFGDAEATASLLSRGANVDGTTASGNCPLYYARNEEIARLLLRHGATVDFRCSAGW